MIFTECKLSAAFIVDVQKREDARGFFARAWCEDEFRAHGLDPAIAQVNVGFSPARGTLRGMHYQEAPYAEVKLIRCTRGAVYDVIADIRAGSPTYGEWFGVELTAENHRMLYVPAGFAHGYQTLEDNSEIYYHTSVRYHPEAARGLRYNDPWLGIQWPLPPVMVSPADLSWPDFADTLDVCGGVYGYRR